MKLPWVFGKTIREPSFHFQKVKLRAPTEVPMGLLYFLVLASVFYIFIGGVYDVVQTPESIGGAFQPEIFLKALDQQYVLEGLIAGFVMFLGAFGLYLTHYASNFSTDLRRSTTVLVIGILMFVIAALTLNAFFNAKISK